jgi:hypothetical protein
MPFFTISVNGRSIEVSGRDFEEAKYKAQYRYHYGCDIDECKDLSDGKVDNKDDWSEDKVY